MSDMQNISSVAVSAKARLTEMLPLALDRLRKAIDDREPWAIKLLLEAAGLERIASQILGDDNSGGEDPIISTAFERDIVERVLNVFRGEAATEGDTGNGQG
jgi:hypothetical protein